MAEEPRRSGRATKGQHKNASSSPAPAAPPAKKAKSKAQKKSTQPEPEEEDGGDDGAIRCICGNEDPDDKRAFIGCDACEVWQHNVCMGVPDDDDDLPEHYFCEECRPEEHAETLQAKERGENIWETRNKIYHNEKKMSKNRKGKKEVPPGWLKKDIEATSNQETESQEVEVGSKRKRDDATEDLTQNVKAEESDEKPSRGSRQDKKRRSAAPSEDVETAIVDISKLPSDRQRIAQALQKALVEETQAKMKAGSFKTIKGENAKSLGDKFAGSIEYELYMAYNDSSNPQYAAQFRALLFNLKKNKTLMDRLLSGSLLPAELAIMSTSDMQSEELQKQNAAMKEQLDRQALAIQDEGPRYRHTHKGLELIEDEKQALAAEAAAAPPPVRERMSIAEDGAGSPADPDRSDVARSPSQPEHAPLQVETSRPSTANVNRRTSSQQFDMNSIWAKTAQSPTSTTAGPPRPMQMPPRRRSSAPVTQEQGDGTKDDADVDRLLQDDEEAYSPAEYAGPDAIVWRGKLIQSADNVQPTVNARFVAGRDVTPTVAWKDLLSEHLTIDGRLQIPKAEEYLCSLQWSNSSDISVLSLTPYDDAEGFNTVFEYFKSRDRYAVVNKDKPALVKDLYIIPLEAGASLPEHLDILVHCTVKPPIRERMLLATFVVARTPEHHPVTQQGATAPAQQPQPASSSGTNGQHLPHHVRPNAPGPAGSPLNTNTSGFSPTTPRQTSTGGGGFPPNPYSGAAESYSATPSAPHPNPLVNEILGPLQHAPSAQQILAAQPDLEREKLVHLRKILEEYPAARTDIAELGQMLFSGR